MKMSRFILVGASLALSAASAGEASEPAFYAAMTGAMDRMMAAMHARPSGDVDRDFVLMMVPHHRAAIDMAVAELRHGRNSQLKRIAQEIIVDQQQEIAAMDLAAGAPPAASKPAPTQPVCDDRPKAL